jgi:hypothetical protein
MIIYNVLLLHVHKRILNLYMRWKVGARAATIIQMLVMFYDAIEDMDGGQKKRAVLKDLRLYALGLGVTQANINLAVELAVDCVQIGKLKET